MRTVVRDLVVTVSGDGWRHHAARLLTDNEGNVAVFIPPRGSGPAREFRVEGDGAIPPAAASLETTEGETVKYHRRGASCSWPLAKCNVKTATLVEEWPESVVKVSSVWSEDAGEPLSEDAGTDLL